MSSLMHLHMWATPLTTGLRLFPWEVHPEGGNCREFYRRLQAKFAWGTELSAGYQVRADGTLYPWPEAHLEEGNFEPKPGLERDGLRQASFAHDTLHEMTTISQSIPDRSSPGSKGTAPSVAQQDGDEKYATGVTTSKIRVRNNITIGTWNVRTLGMAGKLEELSFEQVPLEHFSIFGLCEVRWKNVGETSTEEGLKLYFSGKEDKHEQGV